MQYRSHLAGILDGMTHPSTDLPSADPDPQLAADVFERGCPSRRTLENVASKWGMLALAALRHGSYRFNALRRRVDGVSEKMLAQTLHALERDGLVDREVHTAIPPRVEYSLTPLGIQVADTLLELIELMEREMPAVCAARQRYDEAKQYETGTGRSMV